MMDELSRLSLQLNRVILVENVDVDLVQDFLFQEGVLTKDDVEIISHEVVSTKRVGKLLDILPSKGPHAFNTFVQSLEHAEYDYLVSKLEDVQLHPSRQRSLSLPEVQAILLDGAVPPRPNVFIGRDDVLDKVKGELAKIKDVPGWVVIHGMGGIGKSVLAAESVRDMRVLSRCFPGGVFWISIGQVDKQKLLFKMQNLLARLDKDVKVAPQNIEEAKDKLRSVFAHQHPRSLLILDDIWDSSTTKAFDIQCRILVTTRDASVTDRVAGRVYKIDITDGFTREQSKEILSSWTDTEIEKLPEEAETIYAEVKGSPFAISMIGALLRDHPQRWNYYTKLLRKRKVGRLRKASSYEYETLTDAVSMSINNLDDETKMFYEDFAVFEDDVKIPAQVLSVLWDEEVEMVEDIMSDLVNKSLAYCEPTEMGSHSNYVYYLHDLQLDFLKENCSDVKALHRKLVEKYRDYCRGQYHLLPEDTYIHWFLGYHMFKAGMYKEMAEVFCDLTFVAAKIKVTGPSDLISDYIKYGNILDSQNAQQRLDFSKFISIHAHLFIGHTPDIIQLGLCEKSGSEVYKQAKALALKNRDTLYLDWCNKDTVGSIFHLTTKLHNGPVLCAQLSPDGSKIMSCGEDKSIKIFDAQSGHELISYNDAHEETITCCSFSHDGKKILSSSEDNMVKIFNIPYLLTTSEQAIQRQNSGKDPSPRVMKESFQFMFSQGDNPNGEMEDGLDAYILRTFVGHKGDVLWCCFSHDDALVASCSLDGEVKLWDAVSGHMMFDLIGHTDGVKSCAFSHDSKYLVSCSYDSSIKVWSVADGKCVYTYKVHRSYPTCCVFVPNTYNIASSADCKITVWQALTGKVLNTYSTRKLTAILHLCFSPNGQFIAAGLSDYAVQVWKTGTSHPVAVFKAHSGWVYSVAFSSDGKKLVSASDDETVILWDTENSQSSDSSCFKRDFDVQFTDDSLLLVAPDNNNQLKIIQGYEGKVCSITPVEKSRIRCCAICPDLTRVAYGCEDGSLKVVHLDADQQVVKITEHLGHTGSVRYCVFSKDCLVSCSDDSTIRIYCDGKEVVVCQGHKEDVRKCKLFDKGRKLLSGSHDGTLKVWNVATGEELLTCAGHDGYVLDCDVSPSETRFVSASVDTTLKLWSAEYGSEVATLAGHEDCVRSCAFAPLHKFLASGDDQGIVKLWSEKGLVHSLRMHKSWVTDIKFSKDGHQLVSISDSIKWWSDTGKHLQSFYLLGSFARYIAASEDFKTFVTTDSAGNLYILKVVE